MQQLITNINRIRKGWFTMNNVHYNVDGLFNTPMKTQLKNALEDLNGVQKVNVDLQRATVEVDFNPPAEEKEIRRAIENIGCKVE
jgi:cation transport ATPase